jgi:transcriptional regulator with PAS, ATPase and Fis domain/CHASE3 domain sensor protein
MRRSLGIQINLGIAAALAIFVAICVVAWDATTRLLDTVHRQLATHRFLDEIDDLRSSLQDAETGQRGYLLTGDERYLEPYRLSITRIGEDLAALRRHAMATPASEAPLPDIERLAAAKLAELEQTIEVRGAGGLDAALVIVETHHGKQVMDDLRAALGRLERLLSTSLERLDGEAGARARRAILVFQLGGVLVLSLFAFSLWAIHRDIGERRAAHALLENANEGLEQRVQERTGELERSKSALETEIAERKAIEADREATLRRIEVSRDDLLRVFEQLRVGALVTDAEGRVSFASRAARDLLGDDRDLAGLPWRDALLVADAVKEELARLALAPPQLRRRLPARVDRSGREAVWMEVEVQDDPLEPRRKIFLLYGIAPLFDLRQPLSDAAQFHELVGDGPAMRRVFAEIRDLARSGAAAFIEGETGVGKELVARAIHRASERRAKPFVAVNCAGLTDSLLASQLFGHRRGAFTGAVQDQKGVFEAAEGGTLFLDEIGDVSPSVQTSLLRVLQEKEISRLGESLPRRVDVRVVTATQRDLAREVAEGRFRADLLYRIRVGRIRVPPLRERREDIPLLVASFLAEACGAAGRSIDGVADEAMARLLTHPWPGNVRELRAAIEFAVIRAKDGVLRVDDLPPEVRDEVLAAASDEAGAAATAQSRITAALEKTHGNRKAAAALLGISRATLYRRLAELGIAGAPKAEDPDAD